MVEVNIGHIEVGRLLLERLSEMNPLLEIKDLTIQYGRQTPSVIGCDLSLAEAEILGLVGESGSGKTTVIRAILGSLARAARISSGQILFQGRNLLNNSETEWRKLRGALISMIFQDCGSMMNPVIKIGRQFVRYIRTHDRSVSKAEAWARGEDMLARMRLPDPGRIMKGYPFELSGGMRQRVGIAVAMTFQPKILLADEPTSALDVTTQAQIVRQMMELRDEFGTSIIIVTHNLGVASYMTDRLMVMQNGRVVEEGGSLSLVEAPGHEYTVALLAAVPQIGGPRYV